MTDKEAMKLALFALDIVKIHYTQSRHINEAITALKERLAQPEQEPVAIDGNTSDGYHTFNELYEFRKAYNAALFNEWAAGGKCSVHKSWRHHDGELCFGGGWFIVVAVLPNGQISNHYEAKDWDLFNIPETECALFEFDGHTSTDVVTRLKAYAHPPQRTEQEPVGFAGIEMWIGNTRIKKLMTQTELHFAIDPWAIVKFNSDSCIDALKEKNND